MRPRRVTVLLRKLLWGRKIPLGPGGRDGSLALRSFAKPVIGPVLVIEHRPDDQSQKVYFKPN